MNLDDAPRLVQEFVAFNADVKRGAGPTNDDVLKWVGVSLDHKPALEALVRAGVDGVYEMARTKGQSQATGDAILTFILFGVHLVRKGVV